MRLIPIDPEIDSQTKDVWTVGSGGRNTLVILRTTIAARDVKRLS
jgi:hypothetical protein